MPKQFRHTITVMPGKQLTLVRDAIGLGGKIYDKTTWISDDIPKAEYIVFVFTFPNVKVRNEFATHCRDLKG